MLVVAARTCLNLLDLVSICICQTKGDYDRRCRDALVNNVSQVQFSEDRGQNCHLKRIVLEPEALVIVDVQCLGTRC